MQFFRTKEPCCLSFHFNSGYVDNAPFSLLHLRDLGFDGLDEGGLLYSCDVKFHGITLSVEEHHAGFLNIRKVSFAQIIFCWRNVRAECSVEVVFCPLREL